MKTRLVEVTIQMLTIESMDDLNRMREINLRKQLMPGTFERLEWDDIGWEQIRKIKARVVRKGKTQCPAPR